LNINGNIDCRRRIQEQQRVFSYGDKLTRCLASVSLENLQIGAASFPRKQLGREDHQEQNEKRDCDFFSWPIPLAHSISPFLFLNPFK